MNYRYLIIILASCVITYILADHIYSKDLKPESGATSEMSKRIIGTWIFNDDLVMTFYPNGHWSGGNLNEDTNAIDSNSDGTVGDGGYIPCGMTSSGEYCVVESGVFIRHFGSQHWLIDDNYTDRHTSIGTQYFTFRDNALVDNQEDYEIEYVQQPPSYAVIYENSSNQYVNTEGATLLKSEGTVKHLVYPDETLDDIARYYQIPKKKIMTDNGISDEESLKVGVYLTISAE